MTMPVVTKCELEAQLDVRVEIECTECEAASHSKYYFQPTEVSIRYGKTHEYPWEWQEIVATGPIYKVNGQLGKLKGTRTYFGFTELQLPEWLQTLVNRYMP